MYEGRVEQARGREGGAAPYVGATVVGCKPPCCSGLQAPLL